MWNFEVMIMTAKLHFFDILEYRAALGLQKMSKVRHLFTVLAPLGATDGMDVVYRLSLSAQYLLRIAFAFGPFAK
jgi:hypothetical protein